MAPAATTETIQQVAEQVQQKVLPFNASKGKTSNGDGNETRNPWAKDGQALPALETNHKEPLKLTGVLDKFESFDVTPTIGREYINVDLLEWLRAPNSDELLRDLAITSE